MYKGLVDSTVCFIDILGFSNMITNEFGKGKGEELFENFYSIITDIYKWMKETNKINGEIKIFTDNIVLGKPIRDDGESELGSIFTTISAYQLQLALEGMFVRGGITTGLHYMDDDIVFGPALIEAYNLESKEANVPRVILSESAVELVHDHVKYYSKDFESPQERDLLIDSDGNWFINYLEASIIDYSEESYVEAIECLKKHKMIVENKLDCYKNNSKIFSKFLWVANYHNYFCSYRFKGFDELLVNSDRMTISPRLIDRIKDIV